MYRKVREDWNFLKNIDMFKQSFIMTLASLSQESVSMTRDGFKAKLDTLGDELSKNMVETLLHCVGEDDVVRYYRFSIDEYVFNYLAIPTTTVRGKFKDVPDDSVAVCNVEIHSGVRSNGENGIVRVDAAIVIGLNDPIVTAKFLPHLVKHEIAHVLLEVIQFEHPDEFKLFRKDVGADTYKYFIEFLCDYIQFDYLVMNRFIPKPIPTFREWMSEIKTKVAGAFYSRFLDAIEPLYVQGY